MQDHSVHAPQRQSEVSSSQAVERLYELSYNGDSENKGFWQLDSVVQERLLQAYGLPDAMDYVTHQTAD